MSFAVRKFWKVSLLVASGLPLVLHASPDSNYSQRILFDNSLSPGNYFYSTGIAFAPSTLSTESGKLPVDTHTFLSGPNSLRFEWESAASGGWVAELRLYKWRNRTILFPGEELSLWVNAAEKLAPSALPRLALKDVDGNFSHPIELSDYAHELDVGKWTNIRVPLSSSRLPPSTILKLIVPRRLFLPRGQRTIVNTLCLWMTSALRVPRQS